MCFCWQKMYLRLYADNCFIIVFFSNAVFICGQVTVSLSSSYGGDFNLSLLLHFWCSLDFPRIWQDCIKTLTYKTVSYIPWHNEVHLDLSMCICRCPGLVVCTGFLLQAFRSLLGDCCSSWAELPGALRVFALALQGLPPFRGPRPNAQCHVPAMGRGVRDCKHRTCPA